MPILLELILYITVATPTHYHHKLLMVHLRACLHGYQEPRGNVSFKSLAERIQKCSAELQVHSCNYSHTSCHAI